MIKRILFVIAVLMFFSGWLSFYLNNDTACVISSLVKKGNIRSNHLVYQVNVFGFLPIARGTFSTGSIEQVGNTPVHHLSLVAGPLKYIAGFLKVSAVIDSYIDIHTLNPVLFRQNLVSPGKEEAKKEVFYDQAGLTMTIGGVKRQILPDTRDPLSAIYGIRKTQFDKIKSLEMNINTNQKNYILKGSVVNKTMKIGAGQYKVVLADASIRRRDKNPYHQSKVGMVLVNDSGENIPVLIKVFASGLYVSARLVEVK